MILESAVVAAPFGVGKLLDLYTTEEAKKRTAAALRRAHTMDWPKFISKWSWWVFTRVYGKKSTSKRFIFGSAVLYFLLCAASVAFLWVLFPTTYASITSAWSFGSTSEKAWWSVAIALGAPLYVLANAQTLYFLEILKTSPNFFKFFIVAYADLLITASVALFGVPLLLLIYSNGAIASSSGNVDLQLEFEHLIRSPVTDTLYYINKERTDAEITKLIEATEQSIWFEVRFEARPSPELVRQDKLDRKIAKVAIEQGILNATVQKDGTITHHDARGVAIGFRPIELTFNDRVTSFEEIEDTGVKAARARFCERFPKSLEEGHGYMIPVIIPDVRDKISDACLNQKDVRVSIPVEFNYENVDFSQMYSQFLYMTLSDLISSITSGFKNYLNISPYAYMTERNGTWKHQHMLGERDERSEIAFDEMLLKAHFYEVGGYNWFLNHALPAGTINFAIMSTAVFNLIVMSVVFLLFPFTKLVGNNGLLSKWFSLEESPYGIIGATVTAWLAILALIIAGLS